MHAVETHRRFESFADSVLVPIFLLRALDLVLTDDAELAAPSLLGLSSRFTSVLAIRCRLSQFTTAEKHLIWAWQVRAGTFPTDLPKAQKGGVFQERR